MKAELMGMLLMASVGLAQAGQPELERPRHVPIVQARQAAAVRGVRPQTSTARKAEITRRLFWLAMMMR
jgi:hypothetical protein